MGQDLSAACWQAGMGQKPASDANVLLKACLNTWQVTRKEQTCELFYTSVRHLTPELIGVIAFIACFAASGYLFGYVSAYLLRLREPDLTAEPFLQKSDGFGGVFGFGEKGANGWLLRFLERGETVAEVTLLPTITAFADLLTPDDRFLYGRRRPRQIPLWQLKPESKEFCEAVVTLWEKLLRAEE